jgi:hypothetical protein
MLDGCQVAALPSLGVTVGREPEIRLSPEAGGDLTRSWASRAWLCDLECPAGAIKPIASLGGSPAWRQTILHPFALTSRLARGEVLRAGVRSPQCDTQRSAPSPSSTPSPPTTSTLATSPFVVNRHQTESLSLAGCGASATAASMVPSTITDRVNVRITITPGMGVDIRASTSRSDHRQCLANMVYIAGRVGDTVAMPAYRSMRIVLAAVTVVALAGCMFRPGETPDDHALDPASTASTPDPCPLLTSEEVQQVQGGSIEPAEEIRGNRNGERVCTYFQRETKVITSVSLYPDDRAGFDSEYEVVKDNDPEAEQVPGIGDAAFVTSLGVLYALKGRFVLVVVALGELDQSKAKLLALAPKAVARMP